MTETPITPAPQKLRLWRLLLKAALLFIVFNGVYFVVQPLQLLNRISIYNVLVPGRTRLPVGEYPDQSYSVSILSIDQMLASHEIARPKAPDEYRVIMLGDSAVWGYLLKPDETQAACINRMNLITPSGKKVHVYNLGYPKLTVIKDLLILRHALRYNPDLVVWSTTLASLYPSDQLGFEVITAQYDELAQLVDQYKFKLYQWPLPPEKIPTALNRTFFGQRREIADWMRYQLYGIAWGATGIDHIVPRFVTPKPIKFEPNDQMLLVEPMLMRLSAGQTIVEADISLDVIKAGIGMAADQGIPTLIVNEPMHHVTNDPFRYNFYYPTWAYDGYRLTMQNVTAREGWSYVDMWDVVPPADFTDTDFHMTPEANCTYAAKLNDEILKQAK
jgi:hypothetical protein